MGLQCSCGALTYCTHEVVRFLSGPTGGGEKTTVGSTPTVTIPGTRREHASGCWQCSPSVSQGTFRDSGVDRDACAIAILAPRHPAIGLDLAPRRNLVPGDIGLAGLDTAAMLISIWQNGLENRQLGAAPVRGFMPGGASLGNGVDSVHDDVHSEQQVGSGNLVDDHVASRANVFLDPVEGCFDGIDA